MSLDARPEAGEAMVAGDVMNVGARLQSAAPPGAVLVSDSTYRATSRSIDYEQAEPIEAKGKSEPLGVWIAVGHARASASTSSRRDGHSSWDGARARSPRRGARPREGRAGAAARHPRRSAGDRQEPARVRALAGRGRRSGPHRLASGPVAAVRRRRAFWALGEIVKAQAGILESDSVAAVETKLAGTVADLVSEHEAEWVERNCAPSSGSAANWAPKRGPGPRRSRPGAASSRGSRSGGRWCSCSRTCSGRMTASSSSSTPSSSAWRVSRCSSSAAPVRSCSNGARAGAEGSATR